MMCEMLHAFRLLTKKTGIDAFKVTLSLIILIDQLILVLLQLKRMLDYIVISNT